MTLTLSVLTLITIITHANILPAQAYITIHISSANTEPVAFATIKNYRTRQVFFSDEAGMAKVAGIPGDTLDIRHIAYTPVALRWEQAALKRRIVLRELSYNIQEVSVLYKTGIWYTKFNEAIRRARQSNGVKSQKLTYILRCMYKDTLAEQSEGIVQATINPVKGYESLNFWAAQYGFDPNQPFINTNFTDYLRFFDFFSEKTTRSAFFTPLNARKLGPKNTRIIEQPCVDCPENALQFKIFAPEKTNLAVIAVLDTLLLTFKRLQFTAVDQVGAFFRPVNSQHRIGKIAFEVTHHLQDDQCVALSVVKSVIAYAAQDTSSYQNVHLEAVFQAADLPQFLGHTTAGQISRRHDLDKIAISARAWCGNPEKCPVGMICQPAALLEVLHRLGMSDLLIWQGRFEPGRVKNAAKAYDPNVNFTETALPHFAFGWNFLLLDSAGYIRPVSLPTVADLRATYFTAESQSKATLYFNILFDYCEIARRQLVEKINGQRDVRAVQRTIQTHYDSIAREVATLHFVTSGGNNLKKIRLLNDEISRALGKDNIADFMALPDFQEEIVAFSYADVVALAGNCEKAIEFYNAYLSEDGHGNPTLRANRMECYWKLGRTEEACRDYRYLRQQGYEVADKQRFSGCP